MFGGKAKQELKVMQAKLSHAESEVERLQEALASADKEKSAMQSELKKALKAGEIIPWAVLVTRNNLQIK